MPDPELTRQFGAKLVSLYTGSVLTKLIDIGYEVGLFEASRAGPATSEELAGRAGLQERYVREWLGAMATGGIYRYDAASDTLTVSADRAAAIDAMTRYHDALFGRATSFDPDVRGVSRRAPCM